MWGCCGDNTSQSGSWYMMETCSKMTPAMRGGGGERSRGRLGRRTGGSGVPRCTLPAAVLRSTTAPFRSPQPAARTRRAGRGQGGRMAGGIGVQQKRAGPAPQSEGFNSTTQQLHPPGVWKEARKATWRLRMRIASLTNRLGKPSAKRLRSGRGAGDGRGGAAVARAGGTGTACAGAGSTPHGSQAGRLPPHAATFASFVAPADSTQPQQHQPCTPAPAPALTSK